MMMMMMMIMMIPSKGVFLRVHAARETSCVPVSRSSLKGKRYWSFAHEKTVINRRFL